MWPGLRWQVGSVDGRSGSEKGCVRCRHVGAFPSASMLMTSRLALLAALQGGLLLTQIQRDTKPLEVALDVMLERIEALTIVA